MASPDDHMVHTPPVDLVFDNFEEYKHSAKPWHSPDFYSHPNGFSMCLRVHANGELQGQGSHLSVFVHLTPGEHDSNLHWPFKAAVTFQLRDNFRKAHVDSSAPFDGHEKVACDRVTFGDRAQKGYGTSRLISHRELFEDRKYLYNNALTFRIPSIVNYSSELSSKVPNWYDSTTPSRSIAEHVVTDFSKHRHNDDIDYSSSFLTHHHGYTMCLGVSANGFDSTKRTHLEMGLQIAKGEYDDELPWPFQGKVTVELINWKNNHSHVSYTLDFNKAPVAGCSERVLIDIIAPNAFCTDEFISHQTLISPSSPDTQYIQDDCIRFRVVNVEFPRMM